MFSEVLPLRADIKIKRIDEEQKTAGGIYIPEEANEFGKKCYRAQVLAVGPEVKGLVVGDTILCKFHSGIEIDYDVIILEEKEVVAKY